MKKLNFIKNLFLLFFALSISACEQQKQTQPIAQIHSFNEVNFKAIEPGTLVIFDVDETLIQPTDTYLINEHSAQGEKFRKQLFQHYPDVKDWNFIASIMLQEAQRPLIEPVVIQKIQELKDRNITVIACTGMNTGPHGMIRSLEEWRYNQLKSLGFEGSYKESIFKFEGLKGNPGFYRGVLASDLGPKGPVVGAFLDRVKLHPHKIIMFDDTLDGALRSVQKECEKRGIPFQGYQYKGFKEKPWNEALIQFQADYLIKNKKWLSDEEADKMMQSEKEKMRDRDKIPASNPS